MDFVEFTERGVAFEIVGPFGGRGHMLQIRAPGAELEVSEHADRDAVIRAIDQWLLDHPPLEDADPGFRGFTAEVWGHEERVIETVSFPGRGSLLAIWEDGTLPGPEEFADALEWTGDLVLTVTDGDGVEVVNRREKAEAHVAALALEDCGFRR